MMLSMNMCFDQHQISQLRSVRHPCWDAHPGQEAHGRAAPVVTYLPQRLCLKRKLITMLLFQYLNHEACAWRNTALTDSILSNMARLDCLGSPHSCIKR